MAQLIIIRLHPIEPISAEEFTEYLNDLSITAYELSYDDPTGRDHPGWTAKYYPPSFPPSMADPPIDLPTGFSYYLNPEVSPLQDDRSRIVQHYRVRHWDTAPPLVRVFSIDNYAVATAVIEIDDPSPHSEYQTVDLRLSILRGENELVHNRVYYNVDVVSGSLPDDLNELKDESVVSLHLALTPLGQQLGPNSLVPEDGTPPDYAILLREIERVLAVEPGDLSAIANLSWNQCRHIANEIIWNREAYPLPVPGSSLEQMYTGPNESDSEEEQDRRLFEGELQSYYVRHNMEADRLANYIFSLSAAIQCETESRQATRVNFRFPVLPGEEAPEANVRIREVEAVLEGEGEGPLDPPFIIPAEYFYVLSAIMPHQITAARRYRMAILEHEDQLKERFQLALEEGIIEEPVINPAQAARRIRALFVSDSITPALEVTAGSDIQRLLQAWLDSEVDNIEDFWDTALPVHAAGHLDLILWVLTHQHQLLIKAIKKETDPSHPELDEFVYEWEDCSRSLEEEGIACVWEDVDSVYDLKDRHFELWERLLKNDVERLLAEGLRFSGSEDEKIAAFIRYVQRFFAVTPYVADRLDHSVERPARLGLPTESPFPASFEDVGLTLGSDWNEDDLRTYVESIYAEDLAAQAWLASALRTLNDLYKAALVLEESGEPDRSLSFSIMEALYARGYTSIQQIRAMTAEDLQASLTGTIAYAHASKIYANTEAAATPATGEAESFLAVNPDGALVNCIPPLHLSPLGPVAYLHELLQLLQELSCVTDSITDGETLADHLASRRGSLGDLQASYTNLHTPLPMIDLVNESLEAMVANDQGHGTIYNTSSDEVGGHHLLENGSTKQPAGDTYHHDPPTLLEALPEHSSPATPVAEPQAYETLKSDFTAPELPYSQPLDVNRSYLRYLGTNRFTTMRHFRRDITEFVIDPEKEPDDFQRHLWRYPVRINTAIEYLGITPEEYDMLFTQKLLANRRSGRITLKEILGFTEEEEDWGRMIHVLSEFLERTGLDYCEFLELWRSRYVPFVLKGPNPSFPECEPCCLDRYVIIFEEEMEGRVTLDNVLRRLVVFVRLWQKLQKVKGARYTFAQLKQICETLSLFNGPNINKDFIRQLAAFQILRDEFSLMLAKDTDSEEIELLALWTGPASRHWEWAIAHLLDQIGDTAVLKYQCPIRPPEFLKLLAGNLAPLSRLVGFNPDVDAETWRHEPTHTLRFAEVLAKIYASDFGIGEILYLFTAEEHLGGDDPFPLPPKNEAADEPFEFPDDEAKYSLWELRQKLISAKIADKEASTWTWPRIEGALQQEFGMDTTTGMDAWLSLGRHFFPNILESCGITVDIPNRRYRVALNDTAPLMWNTPPDGPFRYDQHERELWTQIPLTDEAVLAKLSRLRQLNAEEQQAVRDLYFLPRLDLARFAFLFSNFQEAEERLIQEPDENKRWDYFQREFARCYARCRIIAGHLTAHVSETTHSENKEGSGLAWQMLRHLFADENRAVKPWENENGELPGLTWPKHPQGGAFAALLGLAGTGLLGRFYPDAADGLGWREARGPMEAFGPEENTSNSPVPTIIPQMGLTLNFAQERYASIRNGFALSNPEGDFLGGAQEYKVNWSGVLMVEKDGNYQFRAGLPTPDYEPPATENTDDQGWRVMLKRGQKTWVLLSHNWPEETVADAFATQLPLRRGAYELTMDFHQQDPAYDGPEDVRRHQTGFQLKYAGPDSEEQLIVIPFERLYCDAKDHTMAINIKPLESAAKSFLENRYVSSIRDIRRTYQRAFKALLFVHRFGLSAKPVADDGQSEIGYMLAHQEDFRGTSYFRINGDFDLHRACFNFNFLPLLDNYLPPDAGQDDRVQPSVRRMQAMFDWWERIYDYTVMRGESQPAPEYPVWFVFHEAAESHPDDPAHLLRHMGADFRHAPKVLRYFEGYSVTSADLEDERWAVRAWQAEKWIRRLLYHFAGEDIRDIRPDLWASDDPAFIYTGEEQSGNENLTWYVREGCLERGEPRRYEDITQLNDGLRERARTALMAYLCGMDRVALPWGGFATEPKQLSELLLQDVAVGLCQKASRIQEAITAIQLFIQRARLGLEPGFIISDVFRLMWDRKYATFHIWEACKRKEIYSENWIEWDELEEARRSEAFRFLEDQLRRQTLTVPTPGGLEYWPSDPPPEHPNLLLLQGRDAATIKRINPQREGFNLKGTPEVAARTSWLTSIREWIPSNVPYQDPNELPFWIEAAIKLGVAFVRVAAAAEPPASLPFEPHYPLEEPLCCTACGKPHQPVIDEYYFWLVDSHFYDAVLQDAGWDWHDAEALPELLHWNVNPEVYLAWTRVHNGRFQQLRWSTKGVRIGTAENLDLVFTGRREDSLYFEVTGGENPIGHTDSSAPGFRYDMAPDTAEVLPLIIEPEESAYSEELPAFPYFLYFPPGAPVMPPSMFSPALAVAANLRTHCRFEAALKWYALFYNPLFRDNRWCIPFSEDYTPPVAPFSEAFPCCWSSKATDELARERAVLLHYLETLLHWGDALMRLNTAEAFQQARLIYDTAHKILGEDPEIVVVANVEDELQLVSEFEPHFPALNPRLMSLYEKMEDRLSLIHACLNARRLRNGKLHKHHNYWGDSPHRDGWQNTQQVCEDENDWCYPPSPYRFLFLIQKAQELANEVRALGANLLAAFEKGDAEYLASLRSGQERQLLQLALSIRQNQWREADWQVQALLKAKEMVQARRQYYNELILNRLNSGELAYQSLTGSATASRTAANVSEGTGQIMGMIPDFWFGNVGPAPSTEQQLPIGTKLAAVFATVARITNTLADISGTNASLRLTEANWQRREEEWRHQVEVLDIEIEQIERQILAAERRRDIALRELNNHQTQIEHAREVQDFLRDKFTNHELYLWLQKETAALHHQMYELAFHTGRQSQRAFNYERGHTARTFLEAEKWNDLREGLQAGERLQLSLRRMEKAYLDENVREYELTKHISLRRDFPMAFLQLKEKGICEFNIPEWMFDLDYPGQYMRRIKNVTLTIPCVVGPYTGVHGRLTLLCSKTRVDPRLSGPAAPCCEHVIFRDGYEALPDDPRIVAQYAAKEAIATSSGQNDAGLFELNFRDERYLPFEFAGAVSCWRLELPRENNFFDMDTLGDVIMHLNYTSREGGDVLREVANTSTQRHLPGAGVRLFDVPHELPEAWHLLQKKLEEGLPNEFDIRLDRSMFPYLPYDHDLAVRRMEIFFEAPLEGDKDEQVVKFQAIGTGKNPEVEYISCVKSVEWPGFYHGVVEVTLGSLNHEKEKGLGCFTFPADIKDISQFYLFCGYLAERK